MTFTYRDEIEELKKDPVEIRAFTAAIRSLYPRFAEAEDQLLVEHFDETYEGWLMRRSLT